MVIGGLKRLSSYKSSELRVSQIGVNQADGCCKRRSVSASDSIR